MQIIFRLKDFNVDLFPNLTKYSDNISHNIDSIKDSLISYYKFGPFIPKVTIEDDIAIIDIDTESIDKYNDEFQKAVNLSEKRKFPEAKSILENLLKLNPSISEFHRVYGQILEVEGKVEEAKNYLIDALRWDPKNKYALIMMGNIFARHDNDIISANKYFNEVLAIDPNDLYALNNMGGNLANLGKYDEAGKYFDIALEIDDTYPNTHYGKALIYEKNSEYFKSFSSAVHAMKLSLNKDPNINKYAFSLASNSAFEYVKNDKHEQELIQNYLKEIQNDGGG